MARVIALDFGLKRCGLAATDELRIIASPLCTVETAQIRQFLTDYIQKEPVDCLVIGQATARDGSANPLEKPIGELIQYLQKQFPSLEIARYDEHGTSLSARSVINFSVSKKKDRQDKSLVDKISAAIILQNYLGLY